MSYLLDTHTILWCLFSQPKLSLTHSELINNSNEQKFLSVISVWEISLKFSTGKLDLYGHSPEGIVEECVAIGFEVLPQKPDDYASFHRLPKVLKHKDPFDRMLIWQAIQNDLVLLSRDSQLPKYNIHGLKLA